MIFKRLALCGAVALASAGTVCAGEASAQVVQGSFSGSNFTGDGISGIFSYDLAAPVYTSDDDNSKYYFSLTSFQYTQSGVTTTLDPYGLLFHVRNEISDNPFTKDSLSIYGGANSLYYQLDVYGSSNAVIDSADLPSYFNAASAAFTIYYPDRQDGYSLSQINVGSVPEPATWGMMILGMGAIGFTMRRRQKMTTRVFLAA